MEDDIPSVNEGTFTLTDDQTMAMSSYLTQCHQEGKLNDNQYQFYINQLWDHDSTFENNLRDLNLWEGFQAYQNQQTEEARQNQQLIENQKIVLQQTIEKSNQQIREYQDQIGLLQKEIQDLTPDFENAQKRYEQFPDNPRLQAEYQKQLEPIDTLKSQIMNLQSLTETAQNEVLLWETELTNLT